MHGPTNRHNNSIVGRIGTTINAPDHAITSNVENFDPMDHKFSMGYLSKDDWFEIGCRIMLFAAAFMNNAFGFPGLESTRTNSMFSL